MSIIVKIIVAAGTLTSIDEALVKGRSHGRRSVKKRWCMAAL